MSTISALFSLAGIDFRRWWKPQSMASTGLGKAQMVTVWAGMFRAETVQSCVSAFLYPGLIRRCFVYPCIVYPCLGFATVASLTATPAAADFRVCNFTKSRVGIAIGYNDGGGWVTEGWWNITAGNCEALLRGNLAARFYYIYAVDYDRGGEWSGQALMCTRDKEFTIRGTGDCLARGFDRTGFSEVDTGGQQTWTVQLNEAGETPQPGKAFGPLPGGRTLPSLPPPAGSPLR
jgi:uncharacterized membrane protein